MYRIEGNVTIVEPHGDIDATNAYRLIQEGRCRSVGRDRALILDLSGVTFFGDDGLRALLAVGQRCTHSATPWIVVPGSEVGRMMRIGGTPARVPITESVPSALSALRRSLLT